MCIYYRTTFTNKRIIWNKQDTNILTHFKCGHCFECMQEKSDEMIFRGLAQAFSTFKKGGYTLFDTLTYSNKYLPRINEVLGLNLKNNFMCFNSKHIINFLKLLRIRLQRLYKEKNTLTQLYTGEYGTDQNYSHRPHIHIIFYYTGKLNPIELSNLISTCWTYGRTDGAPYKSDMYILNKRVFKSNNAYNLNQTKYICKYLQKESSFDYMIKLRCNKVIKELNPFNDNLTYTQKLEIRKKLNCIRQFRRISNNFGADANINWNNVDNGDCLVDIPDNKTVIKKIMLPVYYIRKRYQNLVYYNIGKDVFSRWEWNEKGKLYIQNKKKFNLFNNKLKFKRLCNTYNKDYEVNILSNYEMNKGILKSNNWKYLINYNSAKYHEIYNDELQLTDKPIDTENVKMFLFNDLSFYKDEILDIQINELKHLHTELGKERHKRYLYMRYLENQLKFIGVKQ